MSADKSHKTLDFMTEHFKNIKFVSPTVFYTSLNDLSIMANGGDLGGVRKAVYPADFHTDKFFVDLLQNLGYDKNGSLLGGKNG